MENANFKTAYFAGGCFWGVENLFQKLDGVLFVQSGYMGGTDDNPSYEDVIYRNSGHFETVKVEYDPEKITYEKLVRYFFEIHDFSQENGQGPDIGYQYLSVLFPQTSDEVHFSREIISELENLGFHVATRIVKCDRFFPAEDYHQNYYNRTRKIPYCHSYRKIF